MAACKRDNDTEDDDARGDFDDFKEGLYELMREHGVGLQASPVHGIHMKDISQADPNDQTAFIEDFIEDLQNNTTDIALQIESSPFPFEEN